MQKEPQLTFMTLATFHVVEIRRLFAVGRLVTRFAVCQSVTLVPKLDCDCSTLTRSSCTQICPREAVGLGKKLASATMASIEEFHLQSRRRWPSSLQFVHEILGRSGLSVLSSVQNLATWPSSPQLWHLERPEFTSSPASSRRASNSSRLFGNDSASRGRSGLSVKRYEMLNFFPMLPWRSMLVKTVTKVLSVAIRKRSTPSLNRPSWSSL